MKAFQAAIRVFNLDALGIDAAVVRLILFGQRLLFRLFLRRFAVREQFGDAFALIALVRLDFDVLHYANSD